MKIFILFLFGLSTVFGYSQDLDKLTYENTQTYEHYVKIKRGNLKEFVTSNGTSVKIGDTLTLGKPFVISDRKDSGLYSTLIAGKPGGFGNIMSGLNGQAPSNLSTIHKYEKVIINKMYYGHLGSKKKPIAVTIQFNPLAGAFGINANAYGDINLAIERGELISDKTPVSRDQAIALLKEAKEELDLGILTEDEFDSKKADLLKIIKKDK